MSSLPKTILFLNDYQAPYCGSFIFSLYRLETALLARGTRCIWVFPKGARERDWCKELQNDERSVAFLSGNTLQQLHMLSTLIRNYRVELVHAHFGLFGRALLAALLHPRLKLIQHVHSDFSGNMPLPLKHRIIRTFRNHITPRRIRRITVGVHMAKKERNSIYIPNGVDFSRAADAASTREQLRMQLNITDKETFVLLFGWSPYIKGVDIAARAKQ